MADDEHPREVIQELMAPLAPGSYLAITHVTADHVAAAAVTAQGVYTSASAPVIARTRAQVTRFFVGLELTGLGVCDVSAWYADTPPAQPHGQAPPAYIYGGVAIKR